MILVAATTVAAMIGEVRSYFLASSWLLAVMGTLILACDVWVMLEGTRLLLGERPARAPAKP
jgi:hypothetical protein